MTTAPQPPHGRPSPGLRASHEDREAVTERLREAAGDGRIDLDELGERLERALTAKTYGDLEPLTADLPALRPARPEPAPQPPLILNGGIGGAQRAGPWLVPSHIVATGGVGGVKLDFTRADCARHEVAIEAHGDVGGVVIVLPEGWFVDSNGFSSPGLGGFKDKTGGTRQQDSPVIRLSGSGGIGGVVARPPNRWERRRLRDAPG